MMKTFSRKFVEKLVVLQRLQKIIENPSKLLLKNCLKYSEGPSEGFCD